MTVSRMPIATAEASLNLCTKLVSPASNQLLLQNKAFVLVQAGQFQYEMRDTQSLPDQRHVRVRVVATGLCGSDVSSA